MSPLFNRFSIFSTAFNRFFIHRAAGLLLIRSPKFSRDFGFLWFCSRTKRFYKHPNPNHNHNPEAIHNPNHNPNPSPKQSNSFLTNLSRDQNRFLPINFQGSIFTLRHGGDSESAYKNTPILITFIPLGPFHKNFLKIWASLLYRFNRFSIFLPFLHTSRCGLRFDSEKKAAFDGCYSY